MQTGQRVVVWSLGLSVLLVGTLLGSTAIGSVWIEPSVVALIVLDAAGAAIGVSWFAYDAHAPHRAIVMNIRLPRVVLGAIVGFALAGAGAVMQGFFRNPMADPSIIGVSSGAAVGAVAVIALGLAGTIGLSGPFGLQLTIPGSFALQLAAFAGGLIAAFVVYAIATEGGRTPVATLLLAGIAVQTFLGAIISILLLQSGENLEEAVYWLMGHLHYSDWGRVRVAIPVVLVCFLFLLAYARDLNVLLLGEEDAQSLGIEVERTKRLLLAVSTLITAAAVAVSGVIGFVGLIVPHMMRLVVGPDHRILLPTSALAGATFLVLTDALARSSVAQLPVGIVTAALGAPFFLYLLRKREVYAL